MVRRSASLRDRRCGPSVREEPTTAMISSTCREFFPEFQQVHIVVPHLMDGGWFCWMRFVEDEAVGGGHQQLAGGTFRRGGQ